MDTSTNAGPDTLRRAVARLRCQHSHPCNPPGGSLARPGDCTKCGISYKHVTSQPIPVTLAGPLATWLESWQWTDLPASAAAPDDYLHARAVARAVLGES